MDSLKKSIPTGVATHNRNAPPHRPGFGIGQRSVSKIQADPYRSLFRIMDI